MTELEGTLEIGKVMAEQLWKVNIQSLEELEQIGSMNVFLLVREQGDKGTCLSFLYGLEGAIQSKELSVEIKTELRNFVNFLEN
ncbi:TfoX/Sxy family DNA transformation protein [Enterococcus sp. BWB1-3]|nr:TfoX/Sxy family DNA transformation protein [Enterococcus sp. BWB1-3]